MPRQVATGHLTRLRGRRFKAQMTNPLTGTVERMLQEQLIDAPHQRKALHAFALGRVIEPGSPDR